MRSRRSSRVQELEHLVRAAGHGSHGSVALAAFLLEHTSEIASELGVDPSALAVPAGATDEDLVPELVALLRDHHARSREARQAELRDVARRAAEALGASVVWQDVGAVLPVHLVFGDVLADTTAKYVRFHADGIDVAIFRRTLLDTCRVMSRFPDVTCFVDSRGLHFRWRGGKGRLRYHPQFVPPRDQDLVLHVPLVRQVEPVATVTAVVAAPPSLPSRYPILLADILVELGFA